MPIKKMHTHKRGHEDANDNHVKASKEIPRPKKLRKIAAEKSSDEQKEPLEDPVAKSICQRRLAFDCMESIVAMRFVPAKQTLTLSTLPYELLVEIAKRLKKHEDFTCFRSVSRSFHLRVNDEDFEGFRFRKSLHYLMLPPVSSSNKDGNVDIRRQFYSLVEGESIVASLGFPAFKTSTKMYLESLGWFLTVEVDGSTSLLDPFSNIEIPLPHIHTFPGAERIPWDKRFVIEKMVLSSRPNENSDFILMVIIGDCKHLAFWRLGDKAWNKIHDRKACFRDVMFGGGERFFAIGSLGTIWVINLAGGNVKCRIIWENAVLRINGCEGQYILKTIYGTLLGIRRIRDKKFFLTSEFHVYHIDDIATGTWRKIRTLGRMAIFLGRNSSFAVNATASASNGGVIKANHIYFTDDFGEYQRSYFTGGNWRGYAGNSPYAKGGSVDCGVYNLETGVVEPIYPVEPLLSNVCPAMWITPNL